MRKSVDEVKSVKEQDIESARRGLFLQLLINEVPYEQIGDFVLRDYSGALPKVT